MIAGDGLFVDSSAQLGKLSLQYAVPAIFQFREFAAGGGLMSYGASGGRPSSSRHYAGRILKGEKPADLPVQQSTKFELIVNLKTAKALGLTFRRPARRRRRGHRMKRREFITLLGGAAAAGRSRRVRSSRRCR